MAGNQFSSPAGGFTPTQRYGRNQPSTSGFNPYGAGAKRYGAGRPMPNIGPVSDRSGYAERDNRARARRNAMLQRMQQEMAGNYNHPSVMRPKAY